MREISTLEATRYEIVVTDGATTLLVGYTARKTQAGILKMLTERLDGVDFARLKMMADYTDTTTESWKVTGREKTISSGKWVVKFSGETQRTRRTTGELPSIYGSEV